MSGEKIAYSVTMSGADFESLKKEIVDLKEKLKVEERATACLLALAWELREIPRVELELGTDFTQHGMWHLHGHAWRVPH